MLTVRRISYLRVISKFALMGENRLNRSLSLLKTRSVLVQPEWRERSSVKITARTHEEAKEDVSPVTGARYFEKVFDGRVGHSRICVTNWAPADGVLRRLPTRTWSREMRTCRCILSPSSAFLVIDRWSRTCHPTTTRRKKARNIGR
jgi:hypothetical protein